jgi:hypothetical protein
MSLADELQRIADDAARTQKRLEELSRACAELRAQLSRPEPDPNPNTTNDASEDVAPRLQSVS